MAGLSLWLRATRFWLQGSRAGRHSTKQRYARLRLEQLSDRTLLSGFAHAGDIGPAVKMIIFELLHSSSDSMRQVEVLLDSLGSRASDPNGVISLEYRDAGHTGQVAEGGNRSSMAAPVAFAQMSSLDGVLGAALQHVYIDRPDGAAFSYPNPGDVRTQLWEDHTLYDSGVIAYLLRPDIEERVDRRDGTDPNGREANESDDNTTHSDTAGTEFTLFEKSDGLANSPSLATVFREVQPGTETELEVPGLKIPDSLVSYDLEAPSPQSELLPLQDGNRALVATLVTGVPGTNANTLPGKPADAEGTLIDSAIGVDGGPAAADFAPMPWLSRPGPAVDPFGAPAPSTENSETHLPDAKLGLPLSDERTGAEAGVRPTLHLLDALFAAGVFQLYRYADSLTSRDPARRPGPSL